MTAEGRKVSERERERGVRGRRKIKNGSGGGGRIVTPQRGALGVMEEKGARERCREGGSY